MGRYGPDWIRLDLWSDLRRLRSKIRPGSRAPDLVACSCSVAAAPHARMHKVKWHVKWWQVKWQVKWACLNLRGFQGWEVQYRKGKHPIYLIYDSGHTNIPQVLEIWPNIPIYLMQAGQQSKYQYTSPTHVITIRYVIDMEYTRCDRIGRF